MLLYWIYSFSFIHYWYLLACRFSLWKWKTAMGINDCHASSMVALQQTDLQKKRMLSIWFTDFSLCFPEGWKKKVFLKSCIHSCHKYTERNLKTSLQQMLHRNLFSFPQWRKCHNWSYIWLKYSILYSIPPWKHSRNDIHVRALHTQRKTYLIGSILTL